MTPEEEREWERLTAGLSREQVAAAVRKVLDPIASLGPLPPDVVVESNPETGELWVTLPSPLRELDLTGDKALVEAPPTVVVEDIGEFTIVKTPTGERILHPDWPGVSVPVYRKPKAP